MTAACRACRRDAECASEVCDDELGTCVDPSKVIYVATDGDDSRPCEQLKPCKTIQHAVDLVGKPGETRTIVRARASDVAYQEHLAVIGKGVVIVGEGATLRARLTDTTVLSVQNGADVTIDGLRVTAAGGAAPGVECQATPSLSTVLKLRRVTVAGNAGGGVSVSRCQFSIVNSFIVGNGNPDDDRAAIAYSILGSCRPRRRRSARVPRRRPAEAHGPDPDHRLAGVAAVALAAARAAAASATSPASDA